MVMILVTVVLCPLHFARRQFIDNGFWDCWILRKLSGRVVDPPPSEFGATRALKRSEIPDQANREILEK
jgi:hypothetical protein